LVLALLALPRALHPQCLQLLPLQQQQHLLLHHACASSCQLVLLLVQWQQMQELPQ
jgi:hypothetical protein